MVVVGVHAKLFELTDMLPLSKQIQLASDFATRGCARVTHSEVPQTPDTEKTFDELRQRLAKTRPARDALMAGTIGVLSPDELRTLRKLLGRIEQTFDDNPDG